jgi:hypothetical protein
MNRSDLKERGRLAHIPTLHAPAKTVGETPTLLDFRITIPPSIDNPVISEHF